MKSQLPFAFSLAGALALVPVALSSEASSAGVQSAEAIYVNGAIWTADPAHPKVEALAVRGDRLLAVGSNHEIRALAGTATRVVDLRSHFVTPGFQDAHAHFPGPLVDRVDLAGADTLQEF